MKRREFLGGALASSAVLSGCSYLRIDPYHVLIRSDVIRTLEDERRILARARTGWTSDGKIRVLYVRGSAYDRGYQHGKLLRDEVRDNLLTMYDGALATFHEEEIFAEAYERMRPFIPQDYLDEMHGLAHGARLPLHVVHHIHALPELTEWGGKKRLKNIVNQMRAGELGTSCSNLCAYSSATAGGKMQVVRILDWGLHKISKLHEYPLICVNVPDDGIPHANIGWVGFLGAVSGINAEKITLGEMGYGSPENETLNGFPMPFLLRDVMKKARNLADVRRILAGSTGTNSFVFLMSDGKAKTAELYVKDRDRFVVFQPGAEIHDGDEKITPIPDTVYGGHYNDRMGTLLKAHHGALDAEVLTRTIIPEIAMKSNFQNVVYSPEDLTFRVSNAKSASERAAEQPYTFFDFGKGLREFVRSE